MAEPGCATILALAGRFIAARRNHDANLYFQERANAAPDRAVFVALDEFFQARRADDVFILRRTAGR